jgi:serine/threonine protein kinase
LLKIHHYESSHSTWKHNTTTSQLHPSTLQTRHSRNQHSKEQKAKGPAGKLFGRHGDIKPENILWFQSRNSDQKGILKITDFGLTEFSHSHSNFYKPKSKMAMTPSYRAPEGDLEGGAGPSSDIWSLGCIFLEFITWLVGGWGLLFEFYESRVDFDPMFFDTQTDIFFEIVKSTNGNTAAMVKPAVTKVKGLPTPRCSVSRLGGLS